MVRTVIPTDFVRVVFYASSVHYLRTTELLSLLEEVTAAGFDRSASINDIEDLKEDPGVLRRKGWDHVCPIDGQIGAAYVHCLKGEDHVGKANFMLSYSWR